MERPKDFFISYTSADRQWAEWIAWQLTQNGYEVVIQAWDFRPGTNFVEQMNRALAQSKPESTASVSSAGILGFWGWAGAGMGPREASSRRDDSPWRLTGHRWARRRRRLMLPPARVG
jgi:hypothetical protein